MPATTDGGTRFEQLSRYASGELGEADAARFEEEWARNPALMRELELDARLQAGLRELRDRGELQAAMSGPWWVQSLRGFALAASVAAVGVAIWLWQGVAARSAIAISAVPASVVGESLAVMRLRSTSGAAAELPLPAEQTTIELRVMPDVRPGPQASRYDVTLLPAVHGESAGAEVPARFAVESVPLGADGFVRVYVDSGQLESGRYRLLVRPSGESVADEFAILVRPRSTDVDRLP